MKQLYIKTIAVRLGVKEWQVENCARLFEDGATIPFVSRYRKERTGGLDEVAVAEIKHWIEVFSEMEKRKETILATIAEAGKLTSDLSDAIENCVETTELEDLYLPFRPKRRTRATVAKEAGLEPLADEIYNLSITDPYREAGKFINENVATAEDALAGARDIIAERLNETASVRETVRGMLRTKRIVSKPTKKSDAPEAQKYRGYFDFSESLAHIASHRLLAVLRAEEEGFLNLKIDADPEKCGNKLYYDFCHEKKYPNNAVAEQIRSSIDDAYKRLLEPSISNEVIKEAKEIVDFGRGAHCRTGIFIGRLLFDGNHRAQTCDFVHIGTLHVAQKLAGISGEGLHITPLPLGINRVKRQRRLAAAAQPGNDNQTVARNGQVDVLQIMLACPVNGNLSFLVLYIFHGSCSSKRMQR